MIQMVKKTIYSLFWLVFSVVMVWTSIYMVKLQYDSRYVTQFWVALGLVILTIVVTLIISNLVDNIPNFSDTKFVIVVFILAFSVRLISVDYFKTVQFSDFSVANDVIKIWNEKGAYLRGAELDWTQVYYAKYPAWYSYVMIVQVVYKVFSRGVINSEIIKYMQVFLSSVTSVILYYTGKEFFGRKKAIQAVLVWTLLPMPIIWVNVMTPDHFSIALLALEMLIWKKLQVRLSCGWDKKVYQYATFYGIVCGLINWFKPLSIMMIIVYILGSVICLRTQNNKTIKSNVKDMVVVCLLVYVSIVLLGKTLIVLDERQIQTDVVDMTWQYMYYGSVTSDDGKWDVEHATEVLYNTLAEYDKDINGANEKFKEMTLEEYRNNFLKFPILWREKYKEVFAGDGLYYWVVGQNEDISSEVGLMYYFVSGFWWAALLIMLAMAGIKQVIVARKYEEQLQAAHIALTIIGFIAIMILSTVQPRYKVIVLPQMVVLSTYGLSFWENVLCYIGKVRTMNKKSND